MSTVTYARRFGTDRYTAHDELTALGCPLPKSDRRYATRPGPRTRKPKPKPAPPERTGLPEGWIVFGSQVLMPVGWTEGGFPYGPTWDEVFGDLAWEDTIGEDDGGESKDDERVQESP